jgi:hypothetical protein
MNRKRMGVSTPQNQIDSQTPSLRGMISVLGDPNNGI